MVIYLSKGGLPELPGLPSVQWIFGYDEPFGFIMQLLVHAEGRCRVNMSSGEVCMGEELVHFTVSMPCSPCYSTGTRPDTEHHLSHAQGMCWLHLWKKISSMKTGLKVHGHIHCRVCLMEKGWRMVRTIPANGSGVLQLHLWWTWERRPGCRLDIWSCKARSELMIRNYLLTSPMTDC